MSGADGAVRAKCLGSVYWTARYLCGFERLSPVLHGAMAGWVQKRWLEGWQRTLVLVTRDYYKTSLLGIAGVVHALIRNPASTHAYVMHNEETAMVKMSEVRAAFESEAMARYFPELAVDTAWRSNEKWGARAFTVRREQTKGTPSVSCYGITKGIAGNHFDDLWWDDVIRGDEDEARAQIDGALRALKKATFLWNNRRFGRLTILGTLHEGGFYERVLARDNFAKLVLGCEVDDRFEALLEELGLQVPAVGSRYVQTRVLPENRGPVLDARGEVLAEAPWSRGTPIFPEQETMASIAQAVMDAEEHALPQLYNLPSGSENRKFREEDCIRYEMVRAESGRPVSAVVGGVEYPVALMVKTLAFDPTGGESVGCDYAAATVVGWMPSVGLAFLLDYWHERATAPVQIDHVLRLADEWDVRVIAPEAAAFQVAMKSFLEEEMRRRVREGRMKRFIPVEPYARGAKAKALWILDSLMPYVEAHQVLFLRGEHDEVVRHLTSLRIKGKSVLGASPALADTLAMQRKYWVYTSAARLQDGIPVEDTLEEGRSRVPPEVVRYGLVCARMAGVTV